jgi:hypothetical protein
MASYQYPNLTVIEEAELDNNGRGLFHTAVIAKVPPSAAETVDHQQIRDAVHEQLHLDLHVQAISKFGADYFIKTHCPQTTAHMLRKVFLHVSSHTLTLIPWTPYYNAIVVPRSTQNTNRRSTNPGVVLPRENLTIQVSGIPPHLCCDLAIHRLLSGISTIHAISFEPWTLTYSVDVCGSRSLIPAVAHIALSRATSRDNLLSIWPVWYETYTQQMLTQMPTPTHDQESSLHGGIATTVLPNIRNSMRQNPRFMHSSLSSPLTLTGDTDLDPEHRHEAYTYPGTKAHSADTAT